MSFLDVVTSIKAELDKYETVYLQQDQDYLLRLIYPRGVKTASPFVYKKVHKGFYLPNTGTISMFECAGTNCGMCKMSAAHQKESGSDKYKAKKRYFYLLLTKTGLFKILELDWFAQRALLGIDSSVKTALVEAMEQGLDPFCPEDGRPVIMSRSSTNTRDIKYEFKGVGIKSDLGEENKRRLAVSSPDLESICYRPTVKESEQIANWTWGKVSQKKG